MFVGIKASSTLEVPLTESESLSGIFIRFSSRAFRGVKAYAEVVSDIWSSCSCSNWDLGRMRAPPKIVFRMKRAVPWREAIWSRTSVDGELMLICWMILRDDSVFLW